MNECFSGNYRPIANDPATWIRRRAAVSDAVSKLLAERAFEVRLRRLGDEGKSLADLQLVGGRI